MDYIGHLSATISATGNLSFDIKTDFNARYSSSVSIPKVVTPESYDGVYEYIPTWEVQTAETANKFLRKNIQIDSIQTYETSNEYGTTFII